MSESYDATSAGVHEPSPLPDPPHQYADADREMEGLDPAQQSLADALRVSFRVLKWIMVALAVAYLFSGITFVAEQEAAVRLRFGQVVGVVGGTATGDATSDAASAGGKRWYLGLPYPIERTLSVPVTAQPLAIRDTFWPAGEAQQQSGPLNPEKDGSLLTGDANIVHGQFVLTYKVVDPERFLRNVGLIVPGKPLPDAAPGAEPARSKMALADRLVRAVAEQAIVEAASQVEADDFIKAGLPSSVVAGRVTDRLTELETGLVAESFSTVNKLMPQEVRPSYEAVTNAAQAMAARRDAAQTARARALGSAAGEAALPRGAGEPPLVELLDRLERARDLDQAATAAALQSRLDWALANLRLPRAFLEQEAGDATAQQIIRQQTAAMTQQLGRPIDAMELPGWTVGGEASQIINTALADRTGVVERTRGEANRVARLAEATRQDPAALRLLKTRELQRARETIFGSQDNEIFYMPQGGEVVLKVNRDPVLVREKQNRDLEAQRNRRQAERAAKEEQ